MWSLVAIKVGRILLEHAPSAARFGVAFFAEETGCIAIVETAFERDRGRGFGRFRLGFEFKLRLLPGIQRYFLVESTDVFIPLAVVRQRDLHMRVVGLFAEELVGVVDELWVGAESTAGVGGYFGSILGVGRALRSLLASSATRFRSASFTSPGCIA